ncbi:LysR family transcriptional regulator [Clostridium tyrobutyricum]|uniref:LysR family transcriptional regulator n=1 Tax=Clostridium tyrobutyricum TaxID=1519 RepID=UPI001C381040|nr:LysR family transcriptional regulator [Clostridium tyrobutyricum]MBV4420586.1 LysR family transcriptional regulator [Clostridium tyrobutyricum]
MNFHQLEYVIAISEEKSISKAAKKLYISQPSLSQYIIRLENNLGVKLFDRTTNSIKLTFAGEKYLKTAKSILNLNIQLRKELSDIAGSKKGRIIIGIPIQIGRYILPLVLPEFNNKFPEIKLSIQEDVTLKLEQMLLDGKIDIAILNLPIKNEKILYKTVCNERIFLVAPRNHPICYHKNSKRDQKLYINSLKNEKFILLKQGQRMRLIADIIFQHSHFKPNILLELTNVDTAHRIAAEGMGFAFIPENVIWLLNTDKYNNYFLIDDINSTIVIAYRQGEYITKATCEFINMVKRIVQLNCKLKVNNERVYNKIYI